MHTIPVFEADSNPEDLASLAREKLPQGAKLTVRSKLGSGTKPDGVNVDHATLSLVIEATKAVFVAAITAIGRVWAAKVSAAKKGNQMSAPLKNPPVVQIDTLDQSHVVVVDELFEQRLRDTMPDNVKTVVHIHLMN